VSFSEIRVLKIARIVPFILFGNYFDFWQKIKNEKNKNLVSVYWPASKSADAEIQLRRESDLLDLQICWTSDLLDSQFCWITRKKNFCSKIIFMILTHFSSLKCKTKKKKNILVTPALF
jgi:hypothetical protein